MKFRIEAYRAEHKAQIVDLSLRAWEPVFTALRPAVQSFVYDAFFPERWAKRQTYDVVQILEHEPSMVWVASGGDDVMAVDPMHHRQGIAKALLEFSADLMRREGMKMVMVETGGDPGHAPARATYESAGFERWPVARYFREL